MLARVVAQLRRFFAALSERVSAWLGHRRASVGTIGTPVTVVPLTEENGGTWERPGWQSSAPEVASWYFQRPTKITGFETRGCTIQEAVAAYVDSINIANCEQLEGKVPIFMLRPQENVEYLLGLPLVMPGQGLHLTVRNLPPGAEIRPVGRQIY